MMGSNIYFLLHFIINTPLIVKLMVICIIQQKKKREEEEEGSSMILEKTKKFDLTCLPADVTYMWCKRFPTRYPIWMHSRRPGTHGFPSGAGQERSCEASAVLGWWDGDGNHGR
ncbi:hypothetical protein SAY87_012076 [Trapa incisa]|uniref:Uncharacterized protein n=1 Tax=Trapa incisa TaxID=236973 RepID=A0AAN7JIM5_9MYRT|nr:hypothetical protein SAY87_012076 [Trapa incisa]